MVVDSLSATLSALSDPTRRSILARLSAGPATVGELAEPFQIRSRRFLNICLIWQRARLVDKRRAGRRHVCTLMPAPFKEVADWLSIIEISGNRRWIAWANICEPWRARRRSAAGGEERRYKIVPTGLAHSLV